MNGADLAELFASVQAEVTAGLASVQLAEAEIEQAAKAHPEMADVLFHAFPLLMPTIVSRAWDNPMVYQGHCRELLERVAAGQDTRPGTAAECCLAMSVVSMKIPLHGAASGFYFRMWRLAFPGHEVWAEGADHSEGLYGGEIDDIERHVRRKLSQPRRKLTAADIECDGEHWREPVACRYATADERDAA